ncbi:hypothetical protein ALC57_18867 [Trachymyrmex cornetzi]|uniref:Uncharacterized protein n=1 Tax=Trachymyrmex cornetzi TaxID=471704 RepID=A0A195D7Q1_9HYME|nr:hypothetical protein ALC57_18867 [Trachymyrmex cornetzi]
MAAIQRRKTSAAKRNLAGVLVPVVLVVAGSKLPPAGLLRYARFSWKIARLPAPSHYARRACDSNYVNTARVEYATTRRITLGKACPTTRLGEIFPEKRLASSMRGRLIRQGKLTDTPRTVDGRLDSSSIRDADESDAGANERPGLRPAGRKTDWPTQMHTVIINLLEILRNRADIHCAASSLGPQRKELCNCCKIL